MLTTLQFTYKTVAPCLESKKKSQFFVFLSPQLSLVIQTSRLPRSIACVSPNSLISLNWLYWGAVESLTDNSHTLQVLGQYLYGCLVVPRSFVALYPVNAERITGFATIR
jgi:hypothetical protein